MTRTAQPPNSLGHSKRICSICGKPSEKMICGACTDKIRADALARKKQEEKGQ
jgi:recombinational DNA repair protein RecR